MPKYRVVTLLFFTFLVNGCASSGIKNQFGEKIDFSVSNLKSGNIRLDCEISCSGEYGANRAALRRLHDEELWGILPREVSRIGLQIDQAYYYLGRSAEGMDAFDAAKTYYSLALTTHKCGGLLDVCDGFKFPEDIYERRKIIAENEKAAAEKLEAERLVTEKAAAEKLEAERVAAEKAAVEKAAAEKVAVEKAAQEKAAMEKAAAERLAIERASAEKAAKKAVSEGAINVVGIVPGISTENQVKSIRSDISFVIGGYALLCVDSYDSAGKLAVLKCLTGKGKASTDTTKGEWVYASNMEIHETLVKGFTKKFGPPDRINEMLQTMGGAKYDKETAIWIDKFGNALFCISRANKIDEGALLLLSAEQRKEDEEAERRSEKARKF